MDRFLIALVVLAAFVALSQAGTGDTTCESDCRCKVKKITEKPNWKQCSWKKMNEDKDDGYIRNCTINKKDKTSVLKVTFNGVIRMSGCYSCCKRWYITFNQKECEFPSTIDTIIYQSNDLNIHRGVSIVGYCSKQPKGEVAVSVNVGECEQWRTGYSTTGNSYTGWNSVSRMIVEEVLMPDDETENVFSLTN